MKEVKEQHYVWPARRKQEVPDKKYEIDRSRRYYFFDVAPCPAPRMTKSDKWKTNPNHWDPLKRQRPAVARYFRFRDTLRRQANELDFKMGETLEMVVFVPMPASWSEKKKDRMSGMPCKVKPDNDNYLKAFRDALSENDGNIWHDDCQKHYAFRGAILVYQ